MRQKTMAGKVVFLRKPPPPPPDLVERERWRQQRRRDLYKLLDELRRTGDQACREMWLLRWELRQGRVDIEADPKALVKLERAERAWRKTYRAAGNWLNQPREGADVAKPVTAIPDPPEE